MTTLDPYDQWRKARRAEQPPEDLTDRVMAAIRHSQSPQPKARGGSWLPAESSSRRQIALAAVAAAVFLLRLAAAFAVFLPS
jgi:hypothetical protein